MIEFYDLYLFTIRDSMVSFHSGHLTENLPRNNHWHVHGVWYGNFQPQGLDLV